jgi:SAM-dependent methyltransferase
MLLAQHTQAHIHSLDNLDQSLHRLAQRAASAQLEKRITTVNGSMDNLPFSPHSFDVIWCENSAYVIGFERALSIWRPFLREDGTLVVSDLIWLRENPAEDVKTFWKSEYPDMTSLAIRRRQIGTHGYVLLGTHALGHKAWANYYQPLAQRIGEVRDQMVGSETITALELEIEMLRRQVEGEFNYIFFALTPRA